MKRQWRDNSVDLHHLTEQNKQKTERHVQCHDPTRRSEPDYLKPRCWEYETLPGGGTTVQLQSDEGCEKMWPMEWWRMEGWSKYIRIIRDSECNCRMQLQWFWQTSKMLIVWYCLILFLHFLLQLLKSRHRLHLNEEGGSTGFDWIAGAHPSEQRWRDPKRRIVCWKETSDLG